MVKINIDTTYGMTTEFNLLLVNDVDLRQAAFGFVARINEVGNNHSVHNKDVG